MAILQMQDVAQVQDAEQEQDQVQDPVSINHSEFISICLDMISMSNTNYAKAVHAKTLYDYLTSQALNYVMRHPHFKDVAIEKAYELQITCTDFHELQNSLNCFLIGIGEPL